MYMAKDSRIQVENSRGHMSTIDNECPGELEGSISSYNDPGRPDVTSGI